MACYIKQADRHQVIVWLNIRMGNTRDLCDFERGMIVGARHAGASISETDSLLGFSRTTVSKVYQELCEKQPVSGNHVGENSSLMRSRRRMAWIVQAKRQATNRQITAQYNSGVQNGPCHGWATAADDHTGFYCYQLITRRSSSGQAITNTGQWGVEKLCLVRWIHHADATGTGIRIWRKDLA